MRAKEFLMSVRQNKATLESLIEMRNHYEDLAQKVTAHYGEQTGGGSREGSGAVEEYSIKALSVQEDIDREIEKFETRVKDVESVIAQLDEEARKMLRMRYFNGWSWRKIEFGMHYARGTIWEKHRRALAKIDKILEARGYADAAGENGDGEGTGEADRQ